MDPLRIWGRYGLALALGLSSAAVGCSDDEADGASATEGSATEGEAPTGSVADPAPVGLAPGEGTCTPNCEERECGDDGCGGDCGTCSDGMCDLFTGLCAPESCEGFTPSGCCQGTTVKWCASGAVVAQSCPEDAPCGWYAAGGYYDCGGFAIAEPTGAAPAACPSCDPECGDKACGDDGCGGSCGTCDGTDICDEATGECLPDPCEGIPFEGCCDGQTLIWCEAGALEEVDCSENPSCGWAPELAYYDCETDGTGDPRGTFPLSCYGPCEPDCADKACGDDGCGGSCGACDEGETCERGACVEVEDPPRDPCLGIPFEGCCQGAVLVWCEEEALQELDCSDSLECGWDDELGYYDCGTAGEADPSGTFALSCPEEER